MKKIFACSLVVLLVIPFYVQGQTEAARRKNFNTKKDIAIEGFDPVSYFDGKPEEGRQAFRTTYKGIEYLFVSKPNLEKFKANPANYEPAYGGWCAFAMGDTGEKVKIDPETYKIEDGKLYLFYNFWGNNTLKDWNKSAGKLKTKGDLNWIKTLD